MNYSQHIESLASLHAVSIEFKEGYKGRSWRKRRHIKISPVRAAVTYAIALHELGHVVGTQSGRRIDKEVQAWEWAESNALEWTEPMIVKAARCVAWYLKMCERHRSMELPPEDHPAWRIAQWAE
jgi:hypothetical protein